MKINEKEVISIFKYINKQVNSDESNEENDYSFGSNQSH
jgi:hypothetical protein